MIIYHHRKYATPNDTQGDMTDALAEMARSRFVRAARAKVNAAVRRLDRALANRLIWLSACAALLALQALLIFTHDPWMDEYQAVLIAVQAPDVPTLLEWLRYEGHPPLWYLILRGIAHFVEPLAALKVAAFGCALLLQIALLAASPFTRAERLLVASSEFVLFEFLTISRSISLGAALLVLCMALWRRRAVWIVIALLPMCDFLFGVLSLLLLAIKWRERALWWPGVLLWLAVSLVAAWTVIPAPDVQPALESQQPVSEAFAWLLYMSNLAVPFQGMFWPRWNEPPNLIIAVWAWFVFLCFAWTQTAREPFCRWLLMGYIAFTFIFAIAVYRLSTRHLVLTALLLILMVWRLRAGGERPRPSFRVWLVVIAACGLATAAINLVRPFDTAAVAAARIRQLGLEEKHWMVWPESRAISPAAVSGMPFERDGEHCMQTFVRWNYRSPAFGRAEFETYLAGEIRRHGRSYLISPIAFTGFSPDLLAPIASIQPGYNGHAYHLYIVGRKAAERPVSLPPCVPGARSFERL